MSPGPNVAVFIQRESVIESTRGCKHGRDVFDSLKLRIAPRIAPQLAKGVVPSREDASLRVDEDHSILASSQASERSFRALFQMYKGRLESVVSVTEAQLPFRVVAQHPEGPFLGLSRDEFEAAGHFEEGREDLYAMRKRTRPREIPLARPHPKAAFRVDGGAAMDTGSHQSDTK